MDIKLLAIDIAKEVFQLHGCDDQGSVVLRKKLRRSELLMFTAQLPQTRIVMESCGGSNYWCRRFKEQGHEAQLIATQHVGAFKKSSQKNDRNDAEAIAEAAMRPQMRYVSVKTLNAQDLQSLHRARQQLVGTRTRLVNQCRGLAMEYGEVMPVGINNFRSDILRVLEEDSELTSVMRGLLSKLKAMIDKLDEEITAIEKTLLSVANQNEHFKRLQGVPGVGPLTASLFIASVGEADVFKNGRHLSAWLGLVPRQHSSGGQTRLMGITKAGDSDLRAMMIHGARAVIRAAIKKQSKSDYSKWMLNLIEKKGWNVASVAVANRNCRVMWHLVKYREDYKEKVA